MKLRTILHFALGTTVAAGVLMTVPWLIGTAIAATGDAPPVPPPGPDAIAAYLTSYGWIVGVLTLAYVIAGALLRTYASSHWLAQGKRLAWATALLGIAGTALQAYVAGTSVSGVIATAVLGLLHIADAQVTPAPAPERSGQSGRVLGAVMLWIAMAGLIGIALGAGCTKEQIAAKATTAAHDLVNCTAQAIGTTPGLDLATLVAIANLVTTERAKCTPAGGALNWDCVEKDAIAEGRVLGGCTLVQLVAGGPVPPPASTPGVAARVAVENPGLAVLERFRAKVAGGATFHTAGGDY